VGGGGGIGNNRGGKNWEGSLKAFRKVPTTTQKEEERPPHLRIRNSGAKGATGGSKPKRAKVSRLFSGKGRK